MSSPSRPFWFLRSSTVRCLTSAVLLPVYIAACTSWHVPSVSPEQVITEDQPSRVRLTLTDDSTMEVQRPHIVGDTLRGLVEGPPSREAPQGATFSLVEQDVLLSDVRYLEVHKTDVGKSVGLGLGIVAVTFVALATAFVIECSGGKCFD